MEREVGTMTKLVEPRGHSACFERDKDDQGDTRENSQSVETIEQAGRRFMRQVRERERKRRRRLLSTMRLYGFLYMISVSQAS